MRKAKNILLFCITLCSLCINTLHAEYTNHTDSLFSFELKDKALPDALILITQHTGFRFSYNSQIINEKEIVSVKAKESSIDNILLQILPPSVTYRKNGKHIILHSTYDAQKKEEKSVLTEKEKTLQKEKLEKIPIQHTGILMDNCHSYVNLKNEEEMKKQLALLLLATTMTTQLAAQESNNPNVIESTPKDVQATESGKTKPFQLSFIYPLGTDWVYSPENTYDISFNILGGVTGRSKGIGLASLFNINKYSTQGVQIAGGFNISGYAPESKEESNAIQLSSMLNYTKAGTATQVSGGINATEKSHMQAAGLINIAKESPIQIAGGINIAKKNHAQLSGMINTSGKSHAQITGGINITKEGTSQISGIANVAQESSCQIAGGINITKKGGFQMGIINVRDTADGVTLGVINIVKKGGIVDFGVEGGDFLNTTLTFRSGTNKLYTILGAGYNYSDEFWYTGGGLGRAFTFTKWLGLNLEFTHYNLYDIPNSWNEYNGLTQINPLLDFRISDKFKIFIGPTLNLMAQYKIDNGAFQINAPYTIAENTYDNTRLSFWVGITGGVKF